MIVERSEHLRLICKQEADRETLGMVPGFQTPKPTSSDKSPPARPHLLILPKQSTNREPGIQISEPGYQHRYHAQYFFVVVCFSR